MSFGASCVLFTSNHKTGHLIANPANPVCNTVESHNPERWLQQEPGGRKGGQHCFVRHHAQNSPMIGARTMLFLLLATIASAGNALTMKFAGSRSDNTWALLFFNYLAATMLSTLSAMRSGLAVGAVSVHVWVLGLITGVLFITTFALLQLNVHVNGATVSSSVTRMGATIPMLCSIALFHEYPTVAGAIGIVVAVMATVLLSMPKDSPAQEEASASCMRGSTDATMRPSPLSYWRWRSSTYPDKPPQAVRANCCEPPTPARQR